MMTVAWNARLPGEWRGDALTFEINAFSNTDRNMLVVSGKLQQASTLNPQHGLQAPRRSAAW